MATAKGGHCGHMENIPDAALRGPGGALHIGHSPHLLGQHSALEGWSKSRDQVRGQRPGKGMSKVGCFYIRD